MHDMAKHEVPVRLWLIAAGVGLLVLAVGAGVLGIRARGSEKSGALASAER